MKEMLSRISAFLRMRGEEGQSAVEYIVISAILVGALVSLPSIYETISHTMQDKYKSYAFGISISDPPSYAFDQEVHTDSGLAEKIGSIFSQIWNMIKNFVIAGTIPSAADMEKLVKDILEQIAGL